MCRAGTTNLGIVIASAAFPVALVAVAALTDPTQIVVGAAARSAVPVYAVMLGVAALVVIGGRSRRARIACACAEIAAASVLLFQHPDLRFSVGFGAFVFLGVTMVWTHTASRALWAWVVFAAIAFDVVAWIALSRVDDRPPSVRFPLPTVASFQSPAGQLAGIVLGIAIVLGSAVLARATVERWCRETS